jgi:proteic killer suppression protein
MKVKVEFKPRAYKQLRKLPEHVVSKLKIWIRFIELVGLSETKKIKGYHDEPLQGDRKGQRSIRLSRSYRAIYREDKGIIHLVIILEVNKHEY